MNEYRVPKKMLPKYEEIAGSAERFCREHLNEEYATLARKMTAALARKRPSPLESGRAQSWVGGIVYALGQINFLSDKSQDPHMSSQELCRLMGVSQATAAGKATAIRRMLDIHRFDPEYSLLSILEQNPLTWFLSVNGILMDIRDAPIEAQIVAYSKGLIPYIPGEPTLPSEDE